MTSVPIIPRRVADTEQLLTQVGAGSVSAFAAFYDRMAGVVHGIARAILREPAAAERATECTFLEVWRSAPQYRAPEDPAHWVALIAVRTALQQRSTPRGDRAAP